MASAQWLVVSDKQRAGVAGGVFRCAGRTYSRRREHGPPLTTGSRRGVTVLELLVVLLILLMVTAAAVPIVVPAMQNRQMREASRLVSSYFSQARSRAIETGRPVGVVIERFNGQPFSLQLSQVEVPPPYSGDTLDATAQSVSVTLPGGNAAIAGETPDEATTMQYFNDLYNSGGTSVGAVWFAAAFPKSSFNARMVRLGDQIQFNGMGPRFVILGPDANSDSVIDDPGGPFMTLEIAYLFPSDTVYTRAITPPQPSIDGVEFPWESGVTGGPAPQRPSYQIFRQPTRSSTPPLQLSNGIVVDLVSSGVGNEGTFMLPSSFGGGDTGAAPLSGPVVSFDPVVMFSPSGRLESVSQAPTGWPAAPANPVYFLLGRRELMYDATAKNRESDVVDQNLSPISTTATALNPPEPPAHFWIAIGYQTGQVTVAEVAANFQEYQPGMAKPFVQVITDALPAARVFAREAQGVGGR